MTWNRSVPKVREPDITLLVMTLGPEQKGWGQAVPTHPIHEHTQDRKMYSDSSGHRVQTYYTFIYFLFIKCFLCKIPVPGALFTLEGQRCLKSVAQNYSASTHGR